MPDKIERRAAACVLGFWVVVLVYCWFFLTSESFVYDTTSALVYSVMWPFMMVIFITSTYKTGKAISKLYKDW